MNTNNSFEETVGSYHTWISDFPGYVDDRDIYKRFVDIVLLTLVHCPDCVVERSRVVPCAGLHTIYVGPCRCDRIYLACIRHGPDGYLRAAAKLLSTTGSVDHLNADLRSTCCMCKRCRRVPRLLRWLWHSPVKTAGKLARWLVFIGIFLVILSESCFELLPAAGIVLAFAMGCITHCLCWK